MPEQRDIKKLDLKESSYGKQFYLKISINSVEVVTTSVISMVIREWVFDLCPRLELEFSDNGRFIDQFPLQDQDLIQIELNNISEQDPSINTTFQLQDYEILHTTPGLLTNDLIKLTGLLATKDFLFPIKNKSYSKKNSKEVLQAIANESNLEFESNISPKDNMIWLQSNQSNADFVKHVVERSFVMDNDTQFAFTDRSGTFKYTSLKTSLKKSEIKRLVFDARFSLNSDLNEDKQNFEKTNEQANKLHGKDTIFYNNYKYRNVAGSINKINSYGIEYSYYDMADFILKTIDNDDHDLGLFSLKRETNIGKITNRMNFGILDTNNMFPDYYKAIAQNKYLQENFFSSYLLVFSRPNPEVKLMDKVHVEVPSLLPLVSNIDEIHSGEYIIGGILHKLSKNSIYETVLIMFRNAIDGSGFYEQGEFKHS